MEFSSQSGEVSIVVMPVHSADLRPRVTPRAANHRGTKWQRRDLSSGLSERRLCSYPHPEPPLQPPACLNMECVVSERKRLRNTDWSSEEMCLRSSTQGFGGNEKFEAIKAGVFLNERGAEQWKGHLKWEEGREGGDVACRRPRRARETRWPRRPSVWGAEETSVALRASWSPASVGGQTCGLRTLARKRKEQVMSGGSGF